MNELNKNIKANIQDVAKALGTVENIKKLEKIFAPVLDLEEM